jgi:pilus assembly protein CpaC
MIPAMRQGTNALLVVAVFVTGMVMMEVAQAQMRPADAQGTSPRVLRIEVTVGKSQVLDFKDPFSHISVTNPVTADIFVVTPTQVLIHGKAAGVTSLVVLYPDKTMYFDVVVQADIGLLKERLKTIVPRDEIDVRVVKDTIILSGNVGSEDTIGQVGTVAEIFAPRKVVNLLKAKDVRAHQVLIEVHVAEVKRTALNEFGVSWIALGSTAAAGFFGGSAFVPGLSPFGTLLPGTNSPNFNFSDLMTFFIASGNRDYAALVTMMAQNGLLRTLAKPNLIALSGKEAKFLSGGEFPYPVPTGTGGGTTVTIEFKPFGVQLIFTPVVREDQTISLRVAPEVSSLDFSQGLQQQGFTIPVIRSSRAATSLDLKDGESFALAGLINNEVLQQVSKVPWLGDIPILGALFRSTSFLNRESELVFIVTPKIVKPFAPGEGPDPTALFELRESERDPRTGINTFVPSVPDVGTVIDRPFGQSDLSGKQPAAK